MEIKWIKGSNFTKIATIYQNNITLNTPCIKIAEKYKWCKIGIDTESNIVYIKMIDDIKTETNIELLNKISIGKTYVRITNKLLINEIYKLTKNNGKSEKYLVEYSKKDNQFIIDLNNKY